MTAAVEELRAAGHRAVLLHCVAAYSRTPAVGALYAMRRSGARPGDAIAAMERALPEADPATRSGRRWSGQAPQLVLESPDRGH